MKKNLLLFILLFVSCFLTKIFGQAPVYSDTSFSYTITSPPSCFPITVMVEYTGSCDFNLDDELQILAPGSNEEYISFQNLTGVSTPPAIYFTYENPGTFEIQYDTWFCFTGYSEVQILTIDPSFQPIQTSIQHTNTGVPINFSCGAYFAVTSASWDFGDGTTATGLNPSHTYTANGTYTVTAVFQTPCGSQIFTTQIQITNEYDFEIVTNDFCAPSVIDLIYTGTIPYDGSFQTHWSGAYNGDGNPHVNGVSLNAGNNTFYFMITDNFNNVLFNLGSKSVNINAPATYTFNESICGGTFEWNSQIYASSGQYTQIFPGAAENGCDSTATLNLTIHNNSFNVGFTSNQQLFTSPAFALQFTNTTPNSSEYNFTWYFGDGTSMVSNNATIFHEYLFNGLYTVTLAAENILTGCIDYTTIVDYIYCTGGASCTHSASISQSGPITSCEGDTVSLMCNEDVSFSYQWRKNGVYIPGNNVPLLEVYQSGTYSVIISQGGCPVMSNNVIVTMNSSPNVPVISSNGSIQPCVGGNVLLSSPSGYSSYLWSTSETSQNINVTASGSYSVEVTDANGCAAISQPLDINASFVSSPSVCVVGVDTLTNFNRIVWEKPLTSTIDSFYVYRESSVAGDYIKIGAKHYDSLSVFMDLNSNPAVQAYRYKISVLDSCEVETPLSDFHKTIHLTINQGVGNTWNLLWSHYEGLTFGSYNLYRGTDPSNMTLLTSLQSNLNSYTDLNPPVGPVFYQIEIVNPNSCSPTKVVNYNNSKSNMVTNQVGGLEENSSFGFSVFPNPTKGILNVEIDNYSSSFELYDMTGKLLIQTTEKTIDVHYLSAGSYFLRAGEWVQKVVIE